MQPFIVDTIGLPHGKSSFKWSVGADFFDSFGNSEIIGSDLEVDLVVNNHGVTLDAECSIDGKVTVPCDRCLEDLEIEVHTGFEESYVPEGDTIDFSQDIYDFVCIALPLQRVHYEGGCNQETIKHLSR